MLQLAGAFFILDYQNFRKPLRLMRLYTVLVTATIAATFERMDQYLLYFTERTASRAILEEVEEVEEALDVLLLFILERALVEGCRIKFSLFAEVCSLIFLIWAPDVLAITITSINFLCT